MARGRALEPLVERPCVTCGLPVVWLFQHKHCWLKEEKERLPDLDVHARHGKGYHVLAKDQSFELYLLWKEGISISATARQVKVAISTVRNRFLELDKVFAVKSTRSDGRKKT